MTLSPRIRQEKVLPGEFLIAQLFRSLRKAGNNLFLHTVDPPYLQTGILWFQLSAVHKFHHHTHDSSVFVCSTPSSVCCAVCFFSLSSAAATTISAVSGDSFCSHPVCFLFAFQTASSQRLPSRLLPVSVCPPDCFSVCPPNCFLLTFALKSASDPLPVSILIHNIVLGEFLRGEQHKGLAVCFHVICRYILLVIPQFVLWCHSKYSICYYTLPNILLNIC